MKTKILTISLCLASLAAHAQTNSNASFGATVYALQNAADNANPSYMVDWATTANGISLSNDKAEIANHLTTLNINANAIAGNLNSISIYAIQKEAIAGPMAYNGKTVSVSEGVAPSVYASNGQSNVVTIKGNDKSVTAYLLPTVLAEGVKVTVQTADGKFYSQNFNSIEAGKNNDLTFTSTTADNLWMSTIPGNTYFSFVSTPGAHDAATSSVSGTFSAYAKCQGEDIATMLKNGVRAFDLRPNYKNNTTITADNLYLYHGTYNTNVTYVDAMKTLVDFVKNNPSEAVSIIMVKEAGLGNTDYSADMWKVINNCHSSYSAYMKLLDNANYTLDDFRGKICYVNRTGTDCTNTVRIYNWPDNGNVTDYSSAIGNKCFACIQDMYNSNGNTKQTEIEKMLEKSSSNTDKKNFHYNFCSSAYKLGGSSPAKYANETNSVISTYLNDGSITGPTGYVYADFIGSSSNGGAELLSAIVNQNYRYVFQGRSALDKPADSNWDLAEGSDVAWNKTGNWADGKGEVYVTENYAGWSSVEQTDFSLTRAVTLPAGTYKMTGYALYRDGAIGAAKLVAKSSERMLGSINVMPMTTISTSGANDLEKAANSFTGTNYLNTVYFVLKEATSLTVGYEGRHTGVKQWFVAGPVNIEKIDRIEEGTDVTSLIANPTIYNKSKNSCPEGWTCEARTAGNSNYTTGTGDTQIENWHGTPANAKFDYRQTLNLPAGKYTLTADLLYRNGEADEVGMYAVDVENQNKVTVSPETVDGALHSVSLQFSCTGSEVNIGIANLKSMTGDWFAADNFTLIYNGMDAIIRNTSTSRYGTICLPYEADAEGATVYAASLNEEKDAVVLDEVSAIEAGVPYIYQATADVQTFTYKEGAVVLTPSDNDLLTGVFANTPVPVGAYVMQTKGEEQKFYIVADGKQPTLSAYKAYLSVAGEAEAKALNIGDATETIIKTIDALTSGNVKIYDINGREQKTLQKGVNIVGGRKVIVR